MSRMTQVASVGSATGAHGAPDLPLLSIVVPVFNEQALLEKHLDEIVSYLQGLHSEFRWELLLINDGSVDDSTRIIQDFARSYENVFALHHPRNFGVGQAMRFGFNNSAGDYVITMDVDLSYDVEHIGSLARTIRDSRAKLVLASPYMKGGAISKVPWHRRVLSVLGNRFLSLFAKGHYSTLTSMMRAYDGKFIRSMSLRSLSMDIMPETVHKTQILGGSIVEIPAHLDWGPQNAFGAARFSSMRAVSHVIATILAGFVFRPFLFFVIPGALLALFAIYVDVWMFIHYFEAMAELEANGAQPGLSSGLALAYERFPHTFVFGLLTTMLAIQLVGLGVLALQSKQNFEEMFYLGSQNRQLSNVVRKRDQATSTDIDKQRV